MPRIGLISDTHSYLDPNVLKHFEDCDEIWHAGDFGTLEVSDKLSVLKPIRGVYGNIDGKEIRIVHPKDQKFEMEGLQIWMTHIGGYPDRYAPEVKKDIAANPPNLFICGHSHILRVMADPKLNNMIYINPGAAGREGFHKVRTIVKFDLENRKIKNMQVIELGKRG
jgi:putative phosphoesterase